MKPLERLPIPLLEWYYEHARTMPWRDDPTPYHVWVSEIMLQQTRVAAVLDYYRRFMEELPDVAALATADEDRLMKLWQGLGYYSRARNLHKAAHMIMEQESGKFPQTVEGLLRLPGVGDYTAGAVGSIAFGLPTPAVDGNVLRVVARITGDEGDISTPAMKAKVTASIRQIIPHQLPGDFNQAMMELGATVCLPNGAPLCDRCPAGGFCVARMTERTGALPVKAKKKERSLQEKNVFLIFREHKVALRRREKKGLLAGLWEFPNASSEEAEPLAQWGIQATEKSRLGRTKHIFTHIEWHMTVDRIKTESEKLPEGWVWADYAALMREYAVPNAFSGCFKWVEEELK